MKSNAPEKPKEASLEEAVLRKKFIHSPFSLRLPDGRVLESEEGNSSFTLIAKDNQTVSAILNRDLMRLIEAYLKGDLDLDGSMWDVVNEREVFRDVHPLHHIWRFIRPVFTGQLRADRKSIVRHYENDNDFFMTFLGQSRCYSQALFDHDDESLDTAQQRKLETAFESCNLKPGDHVLDVGGGWGTFVEYAGKKGVRVTALTLARKSEQYLNNLIKDLKLPCEVTYTDFYEYTSTKLYDAIVILGVMEHLPKYRAVVKQFERLLRPGGRIYLDASSYRKKLSGSTFISRYVFPGNHRFLCLHDFLSQVAKSDLEVKTVHNDRHSYYLTCRAWANRLEAKHEEIAERWGEELYRIFRIYLWGSSHDFYDYTLDAYRVVLERPIK